jgi:hypothetical protein
MNKSGSHRKHENCINRRGSDFSIPLGHDGAGTVYNHSLSTIIQELIRRGGAPPGAAAFIAHY